VERAIRIYAEDFDILDELRKSQGHATMAGAVHVALVNTPHIATIPGWPGGKDVGMPPREPEAAKGAVSEGDVGITTMDGFVGLGKDKPVDRVVIRRGELVVEISLGGEGS